MKYKIIKSDKLSGIKASVYDVYIEEKGKTIFELFLEENINSFKDELVDITKRLKVIGNSTGAREQFFKLKEGNPGDGVCALYDIPNSNLRLYCIRYGPSIIILGGGGHKPKSHRTLQENEKLKKENYFLRNLSKKITSRIKDKTIKYTEDFMDFEGELTFNDEYYE